LGQQMVGRRLADQRLFHCGAALCHHQGHRIENLQWKTPIFLLGKSMRSMVSLCFNRRRSEMKPSESLKDQYKYINYKNQW
jgi:hypothetical protein